MSMIFTTFPEVNQSTILLQMTATNLGEDATSEAVVFDVVAPEVSSMEVMPTVPTAPRSHRPKKLATKEKQKKLMPVRHSPRKKPGGAVEGKNG